MITEDRLGELGDSIAQEPTSLPANIINAANVIGGQCINAVDPWSNLHFMREEYGSVEKIKEKSIESFKSMAGYAIGVAAAASVALEQSPVNENWRVKEGIKTLVATSNPAAVAGRIIEITSYIELGASALIITALFSKSPIVDRPKEAFYRWSEMGGKRAEFRSVVKEDELRVKNNWRVAKGKVPKGPAKKEFKARRAAESLAEKNEKRIAEGKQPKISRDEKKFVKAEKKRTELEEKNEKRIAEGKQPKPELTISKKVSRRIGKELTDFGVALGLGAGIVVFNNALRDRGYRIKQALIDAAKASAEIALVSGFIGWTVAAGTEKAKVGVPLTDHTIHYEKQAQWVVDYGLNTKFIIGMLLLAQSPSILKKLRHRLPDKERPFQDWLAGQEPGEIAVSSTTE